MRSESLGHSFHDPRLLHEALTHPSAGEDFSNQRLEFLGDAVIDLVVAEHLFRSSPGSTEGEMTLAKSSVVNGVTLARCAVSMGLAGSIVVGPGLGNRDQWPASVLGDAFEAVVGAIYLDGGLAAAERVVLGALASEIACAGEGSKDYKSLLIELAQAGSGQRPVFDLLREEGPPHSRRFVVSARIGEMAGEGSGRTKKEAEQRAAEALLQNASLI